MDGYTLRIAASGAGLSFEPEGRRQAADLAYPHSSHPAAGFLRPLPKAPKRVGLAMILRHEELDEAIAAILPCRGRFADAVMVIDAPVAPEFERDGVRVLARPLAGDFAAQRNFAQAQLRTPWALQLDADESVGEDFLDRINGLTAVADQQRLVSLGLRRRNLVDGVLTDLWPDIQYRLNRRELPYSGIVHERPALGSAWRRSTIIIRGAIDHRLNGDRVRARAVAYEAMRPGAGRDADTAALLRPYRD